MKVKLCGLRRPEDIGYINEFKPDYAGFILSGGFKRSVGYEQFLTLESMLDKDIKRVGVFVNEPLESIAEKYADKLDVIQLHGDEDKSYLQALKNVVNCNIWKAVRVKEISDIENADGYGADMLLLDAFSPDSYGGTGKTADYSVIKKAVFSTPFMLAGGLDCDNVENAVRTVSPDGVDISGGIETDGFKDRDKIRKFMKIVRSV